MTPAEVTEILQEILDGINFIIRLCYIVLAAIFVQIVAKSYIWHKVVCLLKRNEKLTERAERLITLAEKHSELADESRQRTKEAAERIAGETSHLAVAAEINKAKLDVVDTKVSEIKEAVTDNSGKSNES